MYSMTAAEEAVHGEYGIWYHEPLLKLSLMIFSSISPFVVQSYSSNHLHKFILTYGLFIIHLSLFQHWYLNYTDFIFSTCSKIQTF